MSQNQDHFLDSNTLLALAFLLLSWFLWDSYMKRKYPPANKTEVQEEPEKKDKKEPLPPPSAKTSSSPLLTEPASATGPEQEFWFRGKELDLLFSSRGFGLKKARLKNYYDRRGKAVEFESLERPLFSSSFEGGGLIPFKIEESETEAGILISAVFSSPELDIKKEFLIKESQFLLEAQTTILPKTEKTPPDWELSFSYPLPPDKKEGLLSLFFIYGMETLKGFVFYKGKEKKRFYEIKACDDGGRGCHTYPQTEIAALGGKYFGAAFVNQSNLLPTISLRESQKSAQVVAQYQFLHQKSQKLKYQIFLGPKSLKSLENLGGNLRLWLDFGFFSWLARPILMILTLLYGFCHNWGMAIIFLTLIIRLLLLPINIKSYKSMKIMQKIQPEIKQIREVYKSEPKKMNEEVMALMKKHKANPLGGCLPMFLQLPVFFALYRVLGESIELYQSPFFLWIQDLSLKDPYYVFPILGGLVLFVQQLITPMNLPKEQARLMKIIPLIFSAFMLNLPSGLTIYIFISGLFGLAQQSFFTKTKSP